MFVSQSPNSATQPCSGTSAGEADRVVRRGRERCRVVGQVWVILFLTTIGADRAVASCGDYLHTRMSSPTISLAHRGSEQVETNEQKPEVPCSGPECRSVPKSSAIPPVTPGGSLRSPESAMIDVGLAVESPDAGNAFVRVHSFQAARGFPEQIDVPPECV